VEGRDESLQSRRTGPLRPPEEIRASFARNLAYFWIGRFGGAVPYFFPVVFALLLFLVRGPRSPEGWLAAGALVLSWLLYIHLIPDNWYGGGGTLGNRYFLNLLPLAAFFAPRGREWWVAGVGALGSAVFLVPLWGGPLRHSLRPGDHATAGPFLVLPPELTMLNDLAVFTEAWRKKQSYGDTEGDAHKHWPADPKAYYLYFLGQGTYGKETHGGVEGFWLRGARRAEVVLRALEPVAKVKVRLIGGPAGDRVRLRVGAASVEAEVGPGETKDLELEPGEGFPYYDTFLYAVDMKSEKSGIAPPPERTPRPLGAFVSLSLETNKRPPRAEYGGSGGVVSPQTREARPIHSAAPEDLPAISRTSDHSRASQTSNAIVAARKTSPPTTPARSTGSACAAHSAAAKTAVASTGRTKRATQPTT
jgi:hypothetical protein